jgi:hypothetical protein
VTAGEKLVLDSGQQPVEPPWVRASGRGDRDDVAVPVARPAVCPARAPVRG